MKKRVDLYGRKLFPRTKKALNKVKKTRLIREKGTKGPVSYNLQFFAKENTSGWKLGDPIDKITKAGNKPTWTTVRQRYWKNEAFYNPKSYSAENLELMKNGRAPLFEKLGVSKELHHINGKKIKNPHNINNLEQVWPWEHAVKDSHRYYNGPKP